MGETEFDILNHNTIGKNGGFFEIVYSSNGLSEKDLHSTSIVIQGLHCPGTEITFYLFLINDDLRIFFKTDPLP